jgi:hypothetical protein
MDFLPDLFADKRDIHQLIFDLAEHSSRPKDLAEFYRRLQTMELYAKVVASNVELHSGGHTVAPDEKFQIRTATLPNGQLFAEFFPDKNDERLRPTFFGIQFREACQMILRMPDLSGLIIRNRTDSWIAIPKDEIERILKSS